MRALDWLQWLLGPSARHDTHAVRSAALFASARTWQVFTSPLARSYSSRHPRRRRWCMRIISDGYLDVDVPPSSVNYSCRWLLALERCSYQPRRCHRSGALSRACCWPRRRRLCLLYLPRASARLSHVRDSHTARRVTLTCTASRRSCACSSQSSLSSARRHGKRGRSAAAALRA